MNVLTSVKDPLIGLGNGELVVLYDDVKSHTGTLIGAAEYVNSEKVNIMTKLGKGLIYSCITEEKAKQLQIPLMTDQSSDGVKSFAVSVDFKDSTTGISTSERSDTIKALTRDDFVESDFKRPGHVFPLISKEIGVLHRIDHPEAVIDVTKMVSDVHVGYMSEILNEDGEVATKEEIVEVSEQFSLPILKLSDILEMKKHQSICSLTGNVVHGRKLGSKIGFPTANLQVFEQNNDLSTGVYGVKVFYHDQLFHGVMNVGYRPTFKNEKHELHYEVHLLEFEEDLYNQEISVEVCFYVREEINFPNVTELVSQINDDVKMVENRFNLILSFG